MKGSTHLAEPQLNATPLIDVLLVLLVMLIFTIPIATHAVKLNLPQGAKGPPPPAIRITIESDGTIYWDNERLASLNALMPRLKAVASQQNPPLIRVMPDKRARYELVAQVLAAAQRTHVDLLTVAPVAVGLVLVVKVTRASPLGLNRQIDRTIHHGNKHNLDKSIHNHHPELFII